MPSAERTRSRNSTRRRNADPEERRRATTALAAALLFASGAASLIFQIIWIKQLSLVVGIDVYAVTIGVGAFFAGLGLGSFVLGRWADRMARPLRLYAFIELGTALLGVAATLALARAAPLFARLEVRVGLLAWALPFALVAPPAVFMGGTLPVLVRMVARGSSPISAKGGRLYAANTMGAIAGALAAPFWLLPAFGVRGSSFAAAALNLMAGISAILVDRKIAATPSAEALSPDGVKSGRLAIALYAIAGGIALGYEVVWSQAIVLFTSTRAFAFAIVLATYLAGLVVGSALFARSAGRVKDPWGVFGLLIAGAGLAALAGIAIMGYWLVYPQSWAQTAVIRWTGSQLAGMCARFFVASDAVVLFPTVLLGAAFPAALRIAGGDARPGRDVGTVVAVNTAGGIVGTLLVGFVLIPSLGLVRALGVLASLGAVIGLIASSRGGSGGARLPRLTWAIATATVVLAVLIPPDRLSTLLARTRGGGEVVFHEESPGGTVAVLEQGRRATTFRRLYIQGVSNSGDAMPSLRYMRLQALLPLLIHKREPRSALVVGFGTGITAGALLPYAGLQRRVCAELLPAVLHSASLFQGNFGAGTDARLEVRLRDGRQELLRSDARYDLITLESPPPSAAGVVNLYSSDFYRLAAERLAPAGLLAQWWPLQAQNIEDSRSLVRSFVDVFPYVSLWTTELHETLLLGSNSLIELDAGTISARFDQSEVRKALSAVGIESAAALVATWVTDREGLVRFAGTALPVTDDRPRIEYATWVRPNEILKVLPELQELSTVPPVSNADEAFRLEFNRQRRALWNFYIASLAGYRGDQETWARSLDAAMSADPSNAYYRWIAFGRS